MSARQRTERGNSGAGRILTDAGGLWAFNIASLGVAVPVRGLNTLRLSAGCATIAGSRKLPQVLLPCTAAPFLSCPGGSASKPRGGN
jgi:hypothetical protein